MEAHQVKTRRAIAAMKCLGIKEEITKTAVGKLLDLYQHWDFIEQDNYRVLADVIFEEEEEKNKNEERGVHKKHEQLQISGPGNSLQVDERKRKRPVEDTEDEESLSPFCPMRSMHRRHSQGSSSMSTTGSTGILLKDPKVEDVEIVGTPSRQQHQSGTGILLLSKKPSETSNDKPITFNINKIPFSSIHPDRIPIGRPQNENMNSEINVASASYVNPSFEPTTIDKGSPDLEIASLSTGDGKLSLNITKDDDKVPDQEELLRSFEEKCLETYNIFDLNFSGTGILNLLLESAHEQLGTNSDNQA